MEEDMEQDGVVLYAVMGAVDQCKIVPVDHNYMKRHLCTNIVGLLRNSKGLSMEGLMTKDDGTPCTDKEVRDYLAECLEKGWRVIPVGDCSNFDHQTGCQGHPDKEIKKQLKKELLITSQK